MKPLYVEVSTFACGNISVIKNENEIHKGFIRSDKSRGYSAKEPFLYLFKKGDI
jgi:hypothetical protein